MARAYQMSWEGSPHYRWVKMHKDKRYRVRCAEIGVPESQWTKELSYQAANEWWSKKLAEIDAPTKRQLPRLRTLWAGLPVKQFN